MGQGLCNGIVGVKVIKAQGDPELKVGDCVMLDTKAEIQPGDVFCHLWHNQAKFKRLADGVKLDGYNVMGKATSRIIDLVGADEGLGDSASVSSAMEL